MNLDGQIILCVDKLDQNRKLFESPAIFPKRFYSAGFYIFRKGAPDPGTVCNHRRPVRMTGQLPRLRQLFAFVLFVKIMD